MMNDEKRMKAQRYNLKSEKTLAEAEASGFILHPSSFILDRRAFTLLELLLAVLVFSIVLTAIHVVFFSALKLRARTTEAIERALPLQQTVAIIKRDLENIVPPGGAL